jgi:hypothetical protein
MEVHGTWGRASLGHRGQWSQLPTGPAGSVPAWRGEGTGASVVLRAFGTWGSAKLAQLLGTSWTCNPVGQMWRTSHCRAGWPLLKLSKLPAQPLLASLHAWLLGSAAGVLFHPSVSMFVGSSLRCSRLSPPGHPSTTCLLPGAGEPLCPYLPNILLPPRLLKGSAHLHNALPVHHALDATYLHQVVAADRITTNRDPGFLDPKKSASEVSWSIHKAPAVCPQLESWRDCSSGKEIAADDGKVTDM